MWRRGGAQIVRHRVGKGLEFLVGSFQLGSALQDAFFEFFVELTDLVLGFSSLRDIGTGANPLADAVVRLEHRNAAHQHVAVFAIAAPHAVLGVVQGAILDRTGPARGGALAILRVHHFDPAPALDLLECLAGELTPHGHVARDLPLRVRGPDHL